MTAVMNITRKQRCLAFGLDLLLATGLGLMPFAGIPLAGLYLLLREWRMEALFDYRIFMDCDLNLAIERLTARHLACGLATTPEAARQRAEGSDAANARLILADGCRERADVVIS